MVRLSYKKYRQIHIVKRRRSTTVLNSINGLKNKLNSLVLQKQTSDDHSLNQNSKKDKFDDSKRF